MGCTINNESEESYFNSLISNQLNIWKITHTRMMKKEKDLMNFDFLQCIFPKSTDLKANG